MVKLKDADLRGVDLDADALMGVDTRVNLKGAKYCKHTFPAWLGTTAGRYILWCPACGAYALSNSLQPPRAREAWTHPAH